ncbi:MAG: hypothetical protein WCI71_09110 [Bacteroidota bacterium]
MKFRIKEWIRRYAWAEVFSTLLTFLFGWASSGVTNNYVLIAYAGTIGAATGFYGFIFIRDIYSSYLKREPGTIGAKFLLVVRCLRNMGFEFGLAELLDFLLVRPFCLLYGPVILNNYFWGILAGKTIADIIFFTLSILMFEIRKKHLHWF